MRYLGLRGRWKVVETNTRKIIRRLKREGWVQKTGGKHDKFSNPDRPGVMIVVPRHREQSIGVAEDISLRAGWM